MPQVQEISEHLLELAWRTYDIGVITGEIMGWVALMVGGIGYTMSKKNSNYSSYFLGMFYGGGAALISILFINNVYQAITFVMTGDIGGTDHTDMYPEVLLTVFDFGEKTSTLFELVGASSQVAAIIGMTGFVFGMGLLGISKKRSMYNTQSKSVIYSSIFLMAMSISERVIAAGAYILFTAILEIG